MNIFIHGINQTNAIKRLNTEAEIFSFYERIKDKFPIGDETVEHYNDRNDKLLAAMLTVLASKEQMTMDDTSFSEDDKSLITDCIHYG